MLLRVSREVGSGARPEALGAEAGSRNSRAREYA